MNTNELVQATARGCAMNILLHGIGSEKSVPVIVDDLESALEQFRLIAADLGADVAQASTV